MTVCTQTVGVEVDLSILSISAVDLERMEFRVEVGHSITLTTRHSKNKKKIPNKKKTFPSMFEYFMLVFVFLLTKKMESFLLFV